jgi:dihydrofolate reductase
MTTTLYLAVSLDGLIATSNRELEWPESAWSTWSGYCTSADNLIVGRITYSNLAQVDLSDTWHPKHKIVISSQELDIADSWVQFLSPRQAVDYLVSCNVENIIVGGGRKIGLAFFREKLIDEIILDVQPVLFGSGTQLLGELEEVIDLELITSKSLGHDAVRMHYRIRKTRI